MLFSEPKIPQFCASRVGSTTLRVSVLFSEPKIPQSSKDDALRLLAERFQCSSASRKFLNPVPAHQHAAGRNGFSALQRAENSSIEQSARRVDGSTAVSVLFSEPKIPQSFSVTTCRPEPKSFSALQRAENSSMRRRRRACGRTATFQCSSASRKFLNVVGEWFRNAECWFQCSSASRKFLNATEVATPCRAAPVSVLFSEPKIPQFSAAVTLWLSPPDVSVLFSEPKIPQFTTSAACDQRGREVSVLFSEPKIPQSHQRCEPPLVHSVSVLFSEPKIPQSQ